jgi:hypothetical protein
VVCVSFQLQYLVCITAVKNVFLQGLEINTIVIIIFVMDIDDQLYSVLKTNMIFFGLVE